MIHREHQGRRFPWSAILLAIALAAGCAPSAAAPSDVAPPTITRSPDATPVPSDEGVTAGEPHASTALDPTPTVAPSPSPTPVPSAQAAKPEPFAMNLYRRGDYVAQYTFEWCVGASLQMALNMSTEDSRTSRADQQRLWEMARDRSASPFGGANPRGWTAALNDLGIGPYKLVSLRSFQEAVDTAAAAIRATDRPVGLVMWRGRHAWVMSGFESSADPRISEDFDVTGIRVLDPLYPNGSSVWGPSPKPNSLIRPGTLAKQFVMRDSRRVNLGVPPGYLLVLPVPEA
ncbi:MAG TPA: hypothetical protein VFO05_00195 [Candidatus Limnocylindrales bacterium]|nr:hypothetical protein [Candidatus Limnocylindrales bacterium]